MQLTEREWAGWATGGTPPLPSPPIHAAPAGAQTVQKLLASVFPWSGGSGTAQRGQDGLEFQMFRRDRHTLPREHLLQLGVVDACSSVSVCHFTSFKVTAAFHV